MPLAAGQRLGPYEVVSRLGAGGMGEVYRARDAKLKRDVAVKVLPADVAGDRQRLARFQREAEVLASLNHPHIAHVYGIEDGALVMELVEGEDLSELIARGPMPLDEARQIAEALEAAHDAGIVHRDLKPGNVKVRDDGTDKVLDFGLAKEVGTADPRSTDLANSPTITSPPFGFGSGRPEQRRGAMTDIGMILGTAAYMAPEQAKGKPVDKRADIWAFGAVLYEMLTGRRAFDGENVSETLASVLRAEPDYSVLSPDIPAPLRAVLKRCLTKDVRQRTRDIGDVHIQLDELEPTPDTTAIFFSPDGQSIGFFADGKLKRVPISGGTPTTLADAPDDRGGSWGEDGTIVFAPNRLVRDTRPLIPFSWHPNGRVLAMIRQEPGNIADVVITEFSGDERTGLKAGPLVTFAGTSFAEQEPAFSPDGRWLAYQSNESGRFEICVSGYPGPSGRWQVSNDSGVFPTWGPDGRTLFYRSPEQQIMAITYSVTNGVFSAAAPVPWSPTRLDDLGLLARTFDVHPDGKRMFAIRMPPEERMTSVRVTLISDFLDELRLKVPTTR